MGSNILEALDEALGDDIAKRVGVYGSRARLLHLRSGRVLPCRAIEALAEEGAGEKIFFHCAFVMRERVSEMGVEAYCAANARLRSLVVEALGACTLRGLFVPSSGAVYKKGTHVLDDDRATNPYGVSKREDERVFADLAGSAPLCLPRVFNLSGPSINRIESYALASMIEAVLADRPISIRAAHRVVRSYIHIRDLVALGLSMLLRPQKDDVASFDTAGDDVLELADLAERVRAELGAPDLPILRPPFAKGELDDVYVGEGVVFARLMRAHGLRLRPMAEQIRDTADYLAGLRAAL